MSTKKRTPMQQAVVDLRQRLNLTQRELAAALGVTTVSVCRWETSRSPSGASLVQLAAFARSSGENDLANTFTQSFSEEFHLKEDHPWLGVGLQVVRALFPGHTIGSVFSELYEYKDHPAIAEQYQKVLEELESLHAVAVREALAELQRAPSAERAKRVLRLQETHEQLQKDMRDEKTTP
jgi:transcriptional regulator with XRE-family HTH domain